MNKESTPSFILKTSESRPYPNSPFGSDLNEHIKEQSVFNQDKPFDASQENMESNRGQIDDYSQPKSKSNQNENRVPDTSYGRSVTPPMDYERRVRSHLNFNLHSTHEPDSEDDSNRPMSFPSSSFDGHNFESNREKGQNEPMSSSYNDNDSSYQMSRDFENSPNHEDEPSMYHSGHNSHSPPKMKGFIPMINLNPNFNQEHKNTDYNYSYKKIIPNYDQGPPEDSNPFLSESDSNNNYNSNEISDMPPPGFQKEPDDFNSDNFDKGFEENSNQQYMPKVTQPSHKKASEHSNQRYPSSYTSSFPSFNSQSFNSFFNSHNQGFAPQYNYPSRETNYPNFYFGSGLNSNSKTYQDRDNYFHFYPSTRGTLTLPGTKTQPASLDYPFINHYDSSNKFSAEHKPSYSSPGNYPSTSDKNTFNMNSYESAIPNYLNFAELDNNALDMFPGLIDDNYISPMYDFSSANQVYDSSSIKAANPFASSSTLFPTTSSLNIANANQMPSYMPPYKHNNNGFKFPGLGQFLNNGFGSNINQALISSIGSNLGSGLSAKMKGYSSTLYNTLYNNLGMGGAAYSGSASKLIPQVIKTPLKKMYKVLTGAARR